jgi:NAD(P)-dependent dehydrogenase (short-subunit alcohol dehydrogenase family)
MRAQTQVEFDGDVVIVTGAGRGLGQAYATGLAGRGARVVVVDIDHSAIGETLTAITESGGTAVGFVGDVVTDAVQIARDALATFGRIDALVNNAGVAHSDPFDVISVEDIERLVRINALGTAAMTSAAWAELRRTRGRVVNVTSGAVFGLPGSTAYATGKGGVLGFTRALASEYISSGVAVNAVMPMARTRMYEESGGIAGSDEDQLMTTHFPAEAVSPVVSYLTWRGMLYNGEIFEVAGTAVSRIVFASGPIVEVHTPEDLAEAHDLLWAPTFESIDSLATSVGRKLAFTIGAAESAAPDRRGPLTAERE